ncbi:unnamed protein product [Nezara viridula]|uniref:Uncharacterized protein n=1 Tax=Nezara viridula TaxID=85310 RepID=A0A9P0HHH3_NEZVI|nr:unnamed protein product [Nezara viridula]
MDSEVTISNFIEQDMLWNEINLSSN